MNGQIKFNAAKDQIELCGKPVVSGHAVRELAQKKPRPDLSRPVLGARMVIHGAPRNGRIPLFAGAKPSTPRQWFSVKNEASNDQAEICLYDEIGEDWFGEGDSAKSFKAALDLIPKDRKILVRINSPGGNVWDGLAMYKLLRERKDFVTTQIDGIALSIASVIALGGGKVRIARAGQLMIHDAWTGFFVQGDEETILEESEKAAASLRAAKKSIRVAYTDKTGIPDDELIPLMKKETWYVGDEAKTAGFVDEVSDDAAVANTFDLSGFKRVPEALRKLQNSAPINGGHSPVMNRAQILARLKKLGVTPNDSATDAELIQLLDDAMDAARARADASASAGGASDPNATVINRLKAFEDKYADMENRYATQRNKLITDRVDLFIAERRVTAQDRQHWIDAALKDEKTLDVLARMPQVLPPEGISASVENIGDSPEDICKGVMNLSKPMRSFERGNEIEPKDMSAHAVNRTALILKNLAKLRHQVQNAHTIDSDLKRSVIMTEGMEAFKRRVLLTSIFSTTYNKVPLLGTDKVEVPYYPIFSTTSRTFVDGTGYEFEESSDTQAKEVTIDKRVYQSFKYTSSFLNRQPYFDVSRLFLKQVNQLAIDVIGKADVGVLSRITLANFGAAVKNLIPSAFIPETIVELATLAEQADWPGVGRSLAIDSTFNENIVKSLLKANEAGSDDALRRGMTGQIAGFDIYSNPRIPSNSEGLVGFMCMPSALLVATSPIMPGPGVQKQLVKYDVITDPDSGLSFEYRFWGDADLDTDKEVVECNFGHAVGEVAALERITNI